MLFEIFWSKCPIFHIIIKYMIFQRREKALLWSKELIVEHSSHRASLANYFSVKLEIIFLSTGLFKHVLCAQMHRLIETVLLSTHNICFV